MSQDARRARDLGIPLEGEPGPWNAVTDVAGVEVGSATLVEGEGALSMGAGPVRTGVTAVLPLGRSGIGRAAPAGRSSFNGNGEMTAQAWVDEVGAVSMPIALTNTHAVGPVHRGVLEWSLRVNPSLAGRWHLPVVAETYDGWLNDIDGRHITPETAHAALDAAASGPVTEGSVGGGTGMSCYEFKGGTGTSSRVVRVAGSTVIVGVLVQANFGRRDELVVAGHRVGRLLAEDNPIAEHAEGELPPGAGSCITLVATDAPLLPGQLAALARRVPLGLARTGTTGSHFSGDLSLAWSTANAGALDSRAMHPDATPSLPTLTFLPWGCIDPVYEAVVQAVEEAVLNALVAGRTMTGRDGHRSPGLPVDRVTELFAD